MTKDEVAKFVKSMMTSNTAEDYVKKARAEKTEDKRIIDFDHYSACLGLDMAVWLKNVLDSKHDFAEEYVSAILGDLIDDILSKAVEAFVKASLIAAQMRPETRWEVIPEAAKAHAALLVLQEVWRHGDAKDAFDCMSENLKEYVDKGPTLTSLTAPNINVIRGKAPRGSVH